MRKILFAALVLGATPAMADEARPDIGGLRLEVRAGIERPNLNETIDGTSYVDTLGSSFVYGGEVGYDIPVSDTLTVGPYLSLDSGGSDKCESYAISAPSNPGGSGTACFKSNSNLSAGVRVAFATPKTELYVGLGYNSYDLDFSIRERNAASVPTFSYDSNGGRAGLDVSLGANFTVAKHAYIGIGMKVGEMGDFEGTSFNLQRTQGHVAFGLRF